MALKLNPDYQKVWNKAITCALQIKDYDQCVELCDKYLSKWPKDKDVVKTRAQAVSDKVINLYHKLFVIQPQQTILIFVCYLTFSCFVVLFHFSCLIETSDER